MRTNRHAVLILVISLTLPAVCDAWWWSAFFTATWWQPVLQSIAGAGVLRFLGWDRRLTESGSVLHVNWHANAETNKADAEIHKYMHDHLEELENKMSPKMKKESLEKHTPLEVENALTVGFEHYVEDHLAEVHEMNQKYQNKMEMLGDNFDDQMAKQVKVEPETVKKVLGKVPIGSLAMMISGMLAVVGMTLLATRSSLRQMIWPPASEMVDEEMMPSEE